MKAQKVAQGTTSKTPPQIGFGTDFSLMRHLLAERSPLASLPMALAIPITIPQPQQVPAQMPSAVVSGGTHFQFGQLATRAVREQCAPASMLARAP